MEAFVYSTFSSWAMQSIRTNGLYTHERKVVVLLVLLLFSVIYWLIEESLVIHFYSNKNIFVHDFHTNSPKILPLDPTSGPSPTFYPQPSMSLATLSIFLKQPKSCTGQKKEQSNVFWRPNLEGPVKEGADSTAPSWLPPGWGASSSFWLSIIFQVKNILFLK